MLSPFSNAFSTLNSNGFFSHDAQYNTQTVMVLVVEYVSWFFFVYYTSLVLAFSTHCKAYSVALFIALNRTEGEEKGAS